MDGLYRGSRVYNRERRARSVAPRNPLELFTAKSSLSLYMNYRVNEFRPIRLDSPRAPKWTAGGARTIGVRQRRPCWLGSRVAFDAWSTELTSLGRMN